MSIVLLGFLSLLSGIQYVDIGKPLPHWEEQVGEKDIKRKDSDLSIQGGFKRFWPQSAKDRQV